MNRTAIAALLALTACGRIGFDGAAGDGGSDGHAALVPLALPEGGQLRQVVVAPSDDTRYAYAVGGRIFRILTGEAAFQPCAAVPIDGTPSGVSLVGDTIYATGSQTFASTDHCATWQSVPIDVFTYGMADVAGTTLAMTGDDLRRDDGAGDWLTIAGPPGARYQYVSSRSGNSPLYMFGTHGVGVVTTTNGTTWASTATNFMSVNTAGVAVGSSKTYAITEPNVINVSDVVSGNANGTAFTSAYDLGGTAIAVDPGDPNHSIAAIYDNLGETFDGYATEPALFLRTAAGMPETLIFGIAFTQDRQILLATNLGLYRSPPATSPGALAFSLESSGIEAWEANAILRDGNDVMIATDGGLLVSRDGAPFDIHTEGTSVNTAFSSVIALPGGELWGTGRGVWRSTDRGRSWVAPLYYDNPDGYYGLSIAAHGSTIFVGTRTEIRYSAPPYDEASWLTRTLPDGPATVVALFVLGNELWAGTDSGRLYKSTDDGATFATLPGTTDDILTIGALPDGRLLVGTITGLLLSDTARTSVSMVPGITAGVHSIVVDGTDVVLGTDGGVTISRDGGGTWAPVAETTGANVYGAVLDPGDRSIIYSRYGNGIARAAMR